MHLVVNVALGTGNKQQEMQNLMLIGAAQEKLAVAQGGRSARWSASSTTPTRHASWSRRQASNRPGMFVASPKEVKQAPPQQPKPDPEMAKVQAKAQADQAQIQAKAQMDQQTLQSNIQLKRMEMEADIQLQREKAAADMQIAREKAALDLQLARERAALDAQLKQQELRMAGGPGEVPHRQPAGAGSQHP
jgi:hypothetical protein